MTGERMEVLIVEDNRADAKLVEEVLKDTGEHLEIHSFSRGEEALAFLRGEGPEGGAPRPGLVVLDLHMPGMSGQEFLEHAGERLKGIEVVILSGEPDAAGSSIQGPHRRMVKPGTADEFESMVSSFKDILSGRGRS